MQTPIPSTIVVSVELPEDLHCLGLALTDETAPSMLPLMRRYAATTLDAAACQRCCQRDAAMQRGATQWWHVVACRRSQQRGTAMRRTAATLVERQATTRPR
jgi:hypothetical protein